MSDQPSSPPAGHVFSPSNLAFYANQLRSAYDTAGSWPTDPVDITEETWAAYASVSPPDGMMLGADDQGQPVWVPVPPPPPPPLSKQAQDMLNTGFAITSTSNPTLNGIYPCDAKASAEEGSLLAVIAVGLTLPNNVVVRVDTSGGPHAFTQNEFKDYCQAKLNFQQTLNTIIGNNQGELPEQPTEIP